MHTIETTDIKLARQYPHKQFRGEASKLSVDSGVVYGMVKAVHEVSPGRLLVTIAAKR